MRYYSFHLAERLGKTVAQLLAEIDSAELSEWMAYDRLQDKDYREKLESQAMTDEQRSAALKRMLGGK